MCGFPLMHLDKHLKVLVQQEKRFVAMCEEFPRLSTSNVKEFDRRISRIITPGTLIDESFLNPCDNNYVLAVIPAETSDDMAKPVGLAWMDVSTGEFFSKQCTLENLQDELARIGPREVVLNKSLKASAHPILSMLKENGCPVSYFALEASGTSADAISESSSYPPNLSEIKQKNIVDNESLPAEELSAIQLLTKFLRANLLEHMPILDSPVHEASRQLMQIDSHTIQALEIRENDYEAGVRGSLISVVRRTITSGGARLLARWMCESTFVVIFQTKYD
jgi:DNA mismatch repair ATPase MutS